MSQICFLCKKEMKQKKVTLNLNRRSAKGVWQNFIVHNVPTIGSCEDCNEDLFESEIVREIETAITMIEHSELREFVLNFEQLTQLTS